MKRKIREEINLCFILSMPFLAVAGMFLHWLIVGY